MAFTAGIKGTRALLTARSGACAPAHSRPGPAPAPSAGKHPGLRTASRSWAKVWLAVAAFPLALSAAAETRGRGSGLPSTTPPATRSQGAKLERDEARPRGQPSSPARGILGAPGAAPDALGPSRLGPYGAPPPPYGAAATGSDPVHSSWISGDRARSASSADVRAARRLVAPDLEIVGGPRERGAEVATPPPPGPAQSEPNVKR